MQIVDFTLKKDTENYKYFKVSYSPWWDSNSIKVRNGFVIKSTNDCFWSTDGKRLTACTERAVLSMIEWHENHPF